MIIGKSILFQGFDDATFDHFALTFENISRRRQLSPDNPLPDLAFHLFQLAELPRMDEGDCRAPLACATGSSDPGNGLPENGSR